MQNLALITKIRQCFATGNTESVANDLLNVILSQTNLMEIIIKIFELNNESGEYDKNGDSIFRYMKLEATWILLNFSYGHL